MSKIVCAIHGGAGNISHQQQDEAGVNSRLQTLREILRTAYSSYQNKESAIDLVTQMVQALEDSPQFNAGIGAVLTRDGTVEMDAAMMDGRNRQAGAVTYVKHIKNPIIAARAIMEHSPHLMLAGTGAENFCREQNIELVDNHYFIIDERQKQWEDTKKNQEFISCIDTHSLGTVGAVARDCHGDLAAATSTGGRLNKMPGRIGDTPIIGAGTWADNETCAVSGTGDGEAFIRSGFSHEIDALIRYKSFSLTEACQIVLDKVKRYDARGGVIAIDKNGNGALLFNTTAMYRGYVTTTGNIVAELYIS